MASNQPETQQPDRLRSAAQRALESLEDLIANTTDPGVEALGARYELATALLNTPAEPVLPDADHCQCFRCPKCPCKPDYCNACEPAQQPA
jgi:hypothetical protein